MMKRFGIILLFFIPTLVFSHPGGTDSSGCHTCRTNCSNWGLSYGQYHCHNNRGVPQPLAPIHSRWGSPSGTTYSAPEYEYRKTTPTCPLFASYDILSGGCKCNSGYVVSTDFLGGEKCVSGDSFCRDKYGLWSSYNSFTKECGCDYDYELYEGECQSMDDICEDQFGYNAEHSYGTQCVCKDGYKWNSVGTSCVYEEESSSLSTEELNALWELLNNDLNVKKCGIYSHKTADEKCSCDTGYEWVSFTDPKNLDCQFKVVRTNDSSSSDITSTVINSSAPQNWGKLKKGLTKDEVKVLLGVPTRKVSLSTRDMWFYGKKYRITFEKNILSYWRELH